MKTYENQALKEYIETRLKLSDITNSRFCQKELNAFLNKDSVRICGLYGLRRTGKSTMIYKAIENLEFKDCLYINCSNNDDYTDIENILNETKARYIFIDEITKVSGFLSLSSSLSDNYPDKKIVITGTDSASLLLAKEDELYDRIDLIHTTYISYAEYNYLLKKPIEDYIRYGGTLTDGEKIYNEDNLEEYTNTAITSNICHSIRNTNGELSYKRLYDLYLNGSLETAINKTIELNARQFFINVINGSFDKLHMFGSALELINKHSSSFSVEEKEIIKNWDKNDIYEYICNHIQIQGKSDMNEKDITLITNFLKKLDVLDTTFEGQIIFTQPGMQYALTEVLSEAVIQSAEYQKLYPETQKIVLDKIKQDSYGHILENVIKKDVIECPELTKMEIGHLDNVGNGEFDLYIINPDTHKAMVYEIKRSFIRADKQVQHLRNEEFCKEFEKLHKCTIIEKGVIYQGENYVLDDGILYHNAQDFLLNITQKTIGLFRTDRQIPSACMEDGVQCNDLEQQSEVDLDSDDMLQL